MRRDRGSNDTTGVVLAIMFGVPTIWLMSRGWFWAALCAFCWLFVIVAGIVATFKYRRKARADQRRSDTASRTYRRPEPYRIGQTVRGNGTWRYLGHDQYMPLDEEAVEHKRRLTRERQRRENPVPPTRGDRDHPVRHNPVHTATSHPHREAGPSVSAVIIPNGAVRETAHGQERYQDGVWLRYRDGVWSRDVQDATAGQWAEAHAFQDARKDRWLNPGQDKPHDVAPPRASAAAVRARDEKGRFVKE